MIRLKTRVGDLELQFETVPRGVSGIVFVRDSTGKLTEVSWRREGSRIALRTPEGSFSFVLFSSLNDEGQREYTVYQKDSDRRWSGVRVRRPGEEHASVAQAGKKKGVRIRSQMPGKIVKILGKLGEAVRKDQPVLVMEAMKMENEIRAAQSGRISQLNVTVGQAIETGADLFMIEPEGA